MFYNDNPEDLKLWPGKTIQIMPAPGWSVTWNLDTPHRHTEPLVGWALRADGIVEPMIADETGGVDAGEVQGLIHQVHPSEERPRSIARVVDVVKDRNGWSFAVRCPHCAEIHHHGAGDEPTVEAFRSHLGKRAPHCKATRAYDLADIDGVIPPAVQEAR